MRSIVVLVWLGGCTSSEHDRVADAVIAATDLSVTLLTSNTLSIGEPTEGSFAFSTSCSDGGAMTGTIADLGFDELAFDGCAQRDQVVEGDGIAIQVALLADRWGQVGGYQLEYLARGEETVAGSDLGFGVLDIEVDGIGQPEQTAVLNGNVIYRGNGVAFSNETYPMTSAVQAQ